MSPPSGQGITRRPWRPRRPHQRSSRQSAPTFEPQNLGPTPPIVFEPQTQDLSTTPEASFGSSSFDSPAIRRYLKRVASNASKDEMDHDPDHDSESAHKDRDSSDGEDEGYILKSFGEQTDALAIPGTNTYENDAMPRMPKPPLHTEVKRRRYYYRRGSGGYYDHPSLSRSSSRSRSSLSNRSFEDDVNNSPTSHHPYTRSPTNSNYSASNYSIRSASSLTSSSSVRDFRDLFDCLRQSSSPYSTPIKNSTSSVSPSLSPSPASYYSGPASSSSSPSTRQYDDSPKGSCRRSSKRSRISLGSVCSIKEEDYEDPSPMSSPLAVAKRPRVGPSAGPSRRLPIPSWDDQGTLGSAP